MPRAVLSKRRACYCFSLFVPLVLAATVPAQSIDVSLNVFYTNPANAGSGGTWELVAKTSSQPGIAGLSVLLTNISTAQNNGPRGTVNGSDPAGFSQFFNTFHPLGFRNVTIGQAPIPQGSLEAGDEQSVFYGVGSLTNGLPNLPVVPPGNNVMGPEFNSLTNAMDMPWATGDAFNDMAWNTAARLASGTFMPGLVPGFSMGGGGFANTGNVFTSVGSDTMHGTIAEATITRIIRSNLSMAILPDYNDNGVVDAADYVLWRDTSGQQGTGLAADGNNDGMVNQADYDLWRAHFGAAAAAPATAAAAGAQAHAVPEPNTVFLITMGGGLLWGLRWRIRNSIVVWDAASD
jgi:hypothetical protein